MRESQLHGIYSGHLSGNRVYNMLLGHWWWCRMYVDAMALCKKCPECGIVTGAGCQHRLPLKPIPVQRPFQIIGLDVIDLPCTAQGNKNVVVFQDMFTKWLMVFAIPDHKAEKIASCCVRSLSHCLGSQNHFSLIEVLICCQILNCARCVLPVEHSEVEYNGLSPQV